MKRGEPLRPSARAKKRAPAKRGSDVKPKSAVETVLVLRTCNVDMTAYGGFRWPTSGPVAAPDWRPTKECGNGLHGFLWGQGDGSLASFAPDAKWLVVEVKKDSIVNLGDKVKFPRGIVMFCGDRHGATKFIDERAPRGVNRIVGSTNTGGYGSTNTGGDGSTNTGGDGSTNTGGVGSTNTGGYGSTNTGGYGSTNTGGYGSTNTGGVGSTNTGGYGSTNTGGDGSTNTGGDGSTNTGGDGSTNTGGDRSTNTGGYGSTVRSGDMGLIAIYWWDDGAGRRRVTVGYVGEDGVKPNTFYRCNEAGKLIEVSE